MKKNTEELRIVFMGTSEFAGVIFQGLISEKYNVVAAYTQPDKRTGRKRNWKKPVIKLIAGEKNIPVFQPDKFDKNAIGELKSLKPDLIVVVAYGRILPKAVLEIPPSGCLNVHASLLPKFRGPSPIQNALLLGEEITGITVMLMNEGIDTGNILTQEETRIDESETYPELSQKLSDIGRQLLIATIPEWTSGKIKPKAQDARRATFCQLIERHDGQINWTDDAKSIYDRYRALTPWPGLYTFWKNNNNHVRLKINKISYTEKSGNGRHIGEVFKYEKGIGVKTSKGSVILEEVQLEGKNKAGIKQFINGHPNFIGSVLT